MSACRMRYFYHAEIYLPSQLIDSDMVSGYWVWVELLGHRCLRCDGKLILEMHWVRGGFHFSNDIDVFINLRYVCGGAEGTEAEPIDGKDGFVANWIHLGALSIGVRAR